MGGRPYLVLAPPRTVEAIVGAVKHPRRRSEIASTLARDAAPHLLASAVSERVIDEVRRRPQARENERFDAARAMPYLLTGDILNGIDRVVAARSEGQLEDLFTSEAAALGLQVRKLDRQTFAPPTRAEVATWIEGGLAAIAELRGGGLDRLLGRERPGAEEGWRLLATILSRLGPSFFEGFDRQLGEVRPGRELVPGLRLPGGRAILSADLERLQGSVVVESAARLAARSGAGLLEADAFRYGYRWPPLHSM